MAALPSLPIDAVLADITRTLSQSPRLVLAAPPGAGKTTRVPLHLLETVLPDGQKLLMLEPRRIAARGAAQRMADMIGEPLGQTIGLSTRLERKVSKHTRIEVITDGLFTRRILADPELSGIGVVIFDEVHERRLTSDLGLALAMDVQGALRDDLFLIAMSATLDVARMGRVLNAATVESEGRAYAVETAYLGRPKHRLAEAMAAGVKRALRESDGSVLAFLPGAADIRRTADALSDDVPAGTDVYPLFGSLGPADQDKALRPSTPGRRKVVLSTDIAESALTIEGVHAVVDAGLVRVPKHDPGGRLVRLETQRASRASVDQRRGRAGRTGPGRCYRLWDEAETRGLSADIAPEILSADVSSLMLALAEWGEADPANLTWIDPPPTGRLAAAKAQLQSQGALSETGALTPLGKDMAALPLPPHLAALVCLAETSGERALGAEIAAVLSERGVGGNASDLLDRLSAFRRGSDMRSKALQRQARRWAGNGIAKGEPAKLLAKAWPDAIARRRNTDDGAFLMAGGEAARIDASDALAMHEWIVVADSMGGARGLRIGMAAAISETDVLSITPPESVETARFDPASGKFTARRVSRIGAITLSEQPLPKPSGGAARAALTDAISEHGFTAIGAEDVVAAMCARLDHARSVAADLPEWTPAGLAKTALDWLLGMGGDRVSVPGPGEVKTALEAHLGWAATQALKVEAPVSITLPSGRSA
ncbi:MAG: ATP-dependent helicase HrpB, partial [Pseudomonadota bacterium]